MNVLPQVLEQGILRSERRRILLLIGLLAPVALAVATIFSAPQVFGHFVAPELRAAFRSAAPILLGILVLLIAFEAVVYRWLGTLEKAGKNPGLGFRLVQGAIEVSWVTALLIVSAHAIGPIQTFASPVILLYFAPIAVSALGLDFRLSLWSGVVSAAGFLVAVLLYLPGAEPVPGLPMLTSPHQYIVRIAILIGSGVASGFVASWLRSQVFAALRAARERDLAVSIFGQHVSPQVADRLLHQPAQAFGEERDVCVMFLDIRDFSVFAGKKTAGEVVQYLNLLFDGLIAGVNAHHGIVNKFLGDGFMAVFGAPEGDEQLCANAVRCAFDLLKEVERLNASGKIPPTRIGIGLHVGPAVTGIVGSDVRKEYTVIGDTVNLAARIEQATKQLTCSLLISEAVHAVLPPAEFSALDMGMVELKGQSKPAHLFKLA